MAALPVFRQIGVIADADFVAIEVLPIVWAFALGPLLDLKQFKSYMALIKELSAKIEEEQIRKLQEISSDSRNAETSHFDEILSLPRENTPSVLGDSGRGIDDDFANLVLGKSSSKTQSANTTGDNLGSMNSFLSPTPQQPSAVTGFPSSVIDTKKSQTQNALGSSRSITPDYGMNKFAPLQPATTFTSSATISQSSMIQPFQPATFSNSPIANLNQPANGSSFNANKSNLNVQMPPTNSFSTISTPSNLFNQNIHHSPYLSNPSNISNNSNSYSNISTMSQSAKQFTSSSIPPPVTTLKDSSLNSGNTLQGVGINNASFPANFANKQHQIQQGQKQGLEKYESLL